MVAHLQEEVRKKDNVIAFWKSEKPWEKYEEMEMQRGKALESYIFERERADKAERYAEDMEKVCACACVRVRAL